MRWDDVQYFLETARHGSVGAAARAMQVNHSTVLRRIASLEATLACRLFERLPTGYVLTAQGRALAQSLDAVPDLFGAAALRVAGVDDELRGLVRITAPESLGPALVLPLVREFRALHPQVTVELHFGNAHARLAQREADIAVRGTDAPPETLVGRKVGVLQVAVYASMAYLQQRERAGIVGEDAWVGPDDALAHLPSAQWLAGHVPDERVAVRVNTLRGLYDAVAAGLGLGWLSCPIAAGMPGLVQVRPPLPAFDTDVWVLTHPDLRKVARISAFATFLTQRLRADERLLH